MMHTGTKLRSTKRRVYRAHALAYKLAEVLKAIGETEWSGKIRRLSNRLYVDYLDKSGAA